MDQYNVISQFGTSASYLNQGLSGPSISKIDTGFISLATAWNALFGTIASVCIGQTNNPAAYAKISYMQQCGYALFELLEDMSFHNTFQLFFYGFDMTHDVTLLATNWPGTPSNPITNQQAYYNWGYNAGVLYYHLWHQAATWWYGKPDACHYGTLREETQ